MCRPHLHGDGASETAGTGPAAPAAGRPQHSAEAGLTPGPRGLTVCATGQRGRRHPRPYSRHRIATRWRTSSDMRISSGHDWSTPSSGARFSVASMPSFPP